MIPDLALLRVFHAVMEERNLTAAAVRLGQSQSTVSAALARLREALVASMIWISSSRAMML